MLPITDETPVVEAIEDTLEETSKTASAINDLIEENNFLTEQNKQLNGTAQNAFKMLRDKTMELDAYKVDVLTRLNYIRSAVEHLQQSIKLTEITIIKENKPNVY
jgi:regulator of replication initiation timing